MIRTLALDDVVLQIRDTVSRCLGALGQPAPQSTDTWRKVWSALADLGALGAPLAEHLGGLGSVADAVSVLEPLGRHGINIPFLDGICVPVVLSNHLPNTEALQQAVVDAVGGGAPVILAWMEPHQGWSRRSVDTRACQHESGWQLAGQKVAVRWAPEAGSFIVTAHTPSGVGLFLIPADAPGLNMTRYATADGGSAGDLRLERLVLPASARLDNGDGAFALDLALDAAASLALAEASGAMDRCVEMTVEYLKTRQQFGMPLSKLQALQHRLVDAYVMCETSWSLTLDAIDCLNTETTEDDRIRRVSMAKAHVGRAGRRVAQESLQLHGAIGMTQEYPLGRYLTRLTLLDLSDGDANWHLNRVTQSLSRINDAA